MAYLHYSHGNGLLCPRSIVPHFDNLVYHQDDPDDNRGGCRVTAASEESLAVTAGLMGLDGDELRRALTARVMQATKAAVQLSVQIRFVVFQAFQNVF